MIYIYLIYFSPFLSSIYLVNILSLNIYDKIMKELYLVLLHYTLLSMENILIYLILIHHLFYDL